LLGQTIPGTWNLLDDNTAVQKHFGVTRSKKGNPGKTFGAISKSIKKMNPASHT
jgi:hypothetical protein